MLMVLAWQKGRSNLNGSTVDSSRDASSSSMLHIGVIIPVTGMDGNLARCWWVGFLGKSGSVDASLKYVGAETRRCFWYGNRGRRGGSSTSPSSEDDVEPEEIGERGGGVRGGVPRLM